MDSVSGSLAKMSIKQLQELENIMQCPLTKKMMYDPVTDEKGHSFEREAILRRIGEGKKCPLGDHIIKIENLLPNRALRDLIEILQKNQLVAVDLVNEKEITPCNKAVSKLLELARNAERNRDLKKAIEFYRLVADEGNVSAQDKVNLLQKALVELRGS